KLNAVEKALMEFRAKNDRLPCPGNATFTRNTANFGVEADIPGTCKGGAIGSNQAWGDFAGGDVPVKTLGLPVEYAFDGWGRKFQYMVTTFYTGYRSFSTTHPLQKCGGTVV